MNYLQEHNVNNVFVMICGTTTPKQKEAIMAKTAVDVELFKDLQTWFINNVGSVDFFMEASIEAIDDVLEYTAAIHQNVGRHTQRVELVPRVPS